MTDPLGEVVELFEGPGGRRYLGESVTNAVHMLQTAARAAAAGADPPLVAAALLHDVGYLLIARADGGDPAAEPGDLADIAHPTVGADWLARWLPPAVSEPVRLHVAAKRYLCAVEPGYAAELSSASTRTLGLQGGPMVAAEVAAFTAGGYAAAALAVRGFDDGGKVPAVEVPGIESYRPLLTALRTDR